MGDPVHRRGCEFRERDGKPGRYRRDVCTPAVDNTGVRPGSFRAEGMVGRRCGMPPLLGVPAAGALLLTTITLQCDPAAPAGSTSELDLVMLGTIAPNDEFYGTSFLGAGGATLATDLPTRRSNAVRVRRFRPTRPRIRRPRRPRSRQSRRPHLARRAHPYRLSSRGQRRLLAPVRLEAPPRRPAERRPEHRAPARQCPGAPQVAAGQPRSRSLIPVREPAKRRVQAPSSPRLRLGSVWS